MHTIVTHSAYVKEIIRQYENVMFYNLLVLPHASFGGKCFMEDIVLPCKHISHNGSACKIPIHRTFAHQLVSYNGKFELSICKNKNHDLDISHHKLVGTTLCSISILRLLDMYKHGIKYISEHDNVLDYIGEHCHGAIDIVEHGYLLNTLIKHGHTTVKIIKSPRYGLFLE